VPETAPAPTFDLDNPKLTFVNLFPENFFSLEGLQLIVDEGGGPLVLTVSGCTVEYVYNPENGENSGSWKPCLSFNEVPTRLVLNKTRARAVMDLVRSPFVRDWGGIGQIANKPAIKDGHAQIVIESVPENGRKGSRKKNGDVDLDALNEELGLGQ
jgi:hypothetical protein